MKVKSRFNWSVKKYLEVSQKPFRKRTMKEHLWYLKDLDRRRLSGKWEDNVFEETCFSQYKDWLSKLYDGVVLWDNFDEPYIRSYSPRTLEILENEENLTKEEIHEINN